VQKRAARHEPTHAHVLSPGAHVPGGQTFRVLLMHLDLVCGPFPYGPRIHSEPHPHKPYCRKTLRYSRTSPMSPQTPATGSTWCRPDTYRYAYGLGRAQPSGAYRWPLVCCFPPATLRMKRTAASQKFDRPPEQCSSLTETLREARPGDVTVRVTCAAGGGAGGDLFAFNDTIPLFPAGYWCPMPS